MVRVVPVSRRCHTPQHLGFMKARYEHPGRLRHDVHEERIARACSMARIDGCACCLRICDLGRVSEPERLPAKALELMQDETNLLFSAPPEHWREIAIKASLSTDGFFW
jgi:hypothetical protein